MLEDPKGNINYVWNEFISGDAKLLMPTNKISGDAKHFLHIHYKSQKLRHFTATLCA